MSQNERVFVIACGVLALDIRRVAEEMNLSVGTRFLPGGLHENPAKLRKEVQAAIDEISASGDWDRIAVGYGICGRGTVELRAREIPLAIPRVHDCISLFLGGNAAYKREFKRYPGTYYISAGWYEEKTEPLRQKRPYVYMEEKRVYYDELVAQYGEAHARETFEFLSSWQRNYQRAAFIDTGAGDKSEYADHAREMAKKYDWKYEALKGDTGLLARLLAAESTSDDIVVVPPGYVTLFDTREGGLKASPTLSERDQGNSMQPYIEIIEGAGVKNRHHLQMGLGIDAGGTYTDAVIYDLESGRVLAKNKALTTKWDYTVGIKEALTGLDETLLARAELAAVSTTLATNAIVEGDGQKVGLLIMPPYGLFEKGDIPYEPKAVIAGRLEITGNVIEAVNEETLRQTAREMVDQQGVEAFAVSGFAGSINPEHELAVKGILQAETGCFVSCGHELSDLLNFRTRAETAVLNARIVPRLVKLLGDLKSVLSSLSVAAPVVVVKGDGSLMSADIAVERPVETILSGPAASVAGARFLTGKPDAIVVDMGGTTTDTAALADGHVKVVEEGSRVGGVQTHVRALEIRTTGLGGDSRISCENGEFTIGPRRVAPMAWLGRHHPGVEKALAYVEQRLSIYGGKSKNIQFFTLTGHDHGLKLKASEAKVLGLLEQRPHALEELALGIGVLHPGLVPVGHLMENHVIQCCGLTPTDLLHVKGEFSRWDTETARRTASIFAKLSGRPFDEMIRELLDDIAKRLALELVKKQLDEEIRPDAMDDCGVCQVLMANMFNGGSRDYRVRFKLNRPVIGIGAPIGYFLPRAADLLETEAILSEHADVANAIGAITSHIAVRRQVRIRPDQDGGFFIEGLAGNRRFHGFSEAEAHAKEALCGMVRDMARDAGTSETAVQVETEDRTASTAGGDDIFLERILTALLVGQPDLPKRRRAA
jgi:N-methylhydantoinase A/oxoprolinase/acetone carboxylase beta subunit